MDIIKYILNKPSRKMRKAGCVLGLIANKYRGYNYPTLSPRTLPNGISNGDTMQYVSGDYILQPSDILSVFVSANVNFDVVNIPQSIFIGMINPNTSDAVATKIMTDKTRPRNGQALPDDVATIGIHYFSNTTNFNIVIPKGTTLEQAKDLLTGTVIRYQLATPIDTLNTPPLTQWVDYVGKGGKNLFDVTAPWSIASGALTRPLFGNGFKVIGAVSAQVGYISIPYSLQPNTQYTIQTVAEIISGTARISPRNSTGVGIGAPLTGTGSVTFTTDSTGNGFFYFYNQYNVSTGTFEVNYTNIQLELGTVATAYEPYSYNNALLQGFANTDTSGMALTPFVCETGTPVDYANGTVKNNDFTTTSNIVFGDGASATTLNGKIIATGNGTKATVGVDGQPLNATLTGSANKSYYVEFTAKVPSGATSVTVGTWDGSNTRTVTSPTSPIADKELTYGGVVTQIGVGATTLRPIFRAIFADSATANGKVVEITNFMITPITDNPQITAQETALKRPLTALECDRLFPFVASTGQSKIGVRPLLVFDGVDDLGILANTPSVDIVGTEGFVIAIGFLTPSVMSVAGTLYFDGDNGATAAERKLYLLYNADGSVALVLEGTTFVLASSGSLQPNTMYDLRAYRQGGRLVGKINKAQKSDVANSSNLTSRKYKRIGARTNNADGTAHTTPSKAQEAWMLLFRETYGDLTKADSVIDKIAKDYM